MAFQFHQFDPRPQGAESNKDAIVAADGGHNLLGIEVTIPTLAEQCLLGHLDHHGEGDDSSTPAAVEQALTAELPPEGATLATVRCDADSVAAMAVLANRAEGRLVSEEIVAAIGRFDRLGPAAGRPADEVIAISRQAANFRLPLAERVAWVQALLAGEGDEVEVASLVAARDAEFAAAREASELTLHADGRVALVVSTHRFATQLGYEAASVLVCFNPEMPVDSRDASKGTYRKFTICRHDSHVPVDLVAAMAELNELDEAVTEGSRWGGRGDIGGSPQGVSSSLTTEQVVGVVARHLRRNAPTPTGEFARLLTRIKETGEMPFPGKRSFWAQEAREDWDCGPLGGGRYTHVGKVVFLPGRPMPGPAGKIETPRGWAVNVGLSMGQPLYQLIPEGMVLGDLPCPYCNGAESEDVGQEDCPTCGGTNRVFA